MKIIGAIYGWLDQRTGCKKILDEVLFENIPGGPRWRYVWGSTLSFAFLVQLITGFFLWMAYSPSSQTAWESVYYIQNEMLGGWLLRGIHHFMAHAMMVLLVLHLMQVIIDGAYKAPREVNYFFGLVLLLLVMGLSLTGYLLPWDQKGYWATKVATNISATAPGLGPILQKLVIGGTDYGHHTLTRFFALHAGILPSLIVAAIALHIYLFRRHGITAHRPFRKPDAKFWPDQLLMDSVACLAVMAVVLFFVLKPRLFGGAGEWGAELGAPANPSETFSAARPEWYFLFLFQLLKYFPGSTEIWGAIILPTVVLLIITVMPFLGRWRLGHRFNLGFLTALIVGVAALTWLALADDRGNPDYQQAVELARKDAERVRVLAKSPAGIPSAGAVTLLRNDPFTQGPKIFADKCASCHRFDGHNGLGVIPKDPPGAPDLKGFATRAWLAGLLDPAQISSNHYFGETKFAEGKMARFVKKDVASFTPEQKAQLTTVIAALSAEAALKSQRALDEKEAALIEEGRKLAANDAMRCTECHSFRKADEDATAPDLTGWGSREWLVGIISDPSHARFYGKRNDRMPLFGKDQILDAASIDLVADWLRGEWHEPAGRD